MTPVRCAIYTRKSSEDGLEQGFNSLHAQREACTAYVLSQASEGWVLLPDIYDDGGLSGGTLERPALQRLLADIQDGKIDVIVVYKVDRLTRSLLDFAKLVEALDKAGTSFISITQSFNTTNSMGRLTLNMLLSFAQFEREVTAERIRDKLAASKAKGMWMGGIPPLGYRPDGRTLAVVPEHADLVRRIYANYLEHGSVRLVVDRLCADGIRAPRRKTAAGRSYGGGALSRGQVYTILRNPIYIGCIAHKDVLHPGQHDAIIDRAQWDKVQVRLAGNLKGVRHSAIRGRSTSLLAGRIVDEDGEPLIATHARKGDRRYRYYVSKALQEGKSAPKGLRIPAGEVEQVVAQECAALLDDPLGLAEQAALVFGPADVEPLMARGKQLARDWRELDTTSLAPLIKRVAIYDTRIEIALQVPELAQALGLAPKDTSPATIPRVAAVRPTRTGRAVRLVHDNGAAATADGTDIALVKLIVRAREWWQRMAGGKLDPTTLALQEGVSVSYIVRVMRLAFLSPAIVDAVLDGRLRAGIDSSALLNIRAIDPAWEKQERLAMLRA